MTNYEIVLKARLDEAQKRIAELEAKTERFEWAMREYVKHQEKNNWFCFAQIYDSLMMFDALSEGSADE